MPGVPHLATIPLCDHTCHIRGMSRDDICLYLAPADRARLEALIGAQLQKSLPLDENANMFNDATQE